MIGRFRTDLELDADASRPGAFRLRRRLWARALSASLVALGFLAFALDLLWERHLVAALQLPLSLGLLWLHLRAELDDWTFTGETAVRRSFSLRSLRFCETRLPIVQVKEVVVAQEGKRACAWLETRAGERHALVIGSPGEVAAIAGAFERALHFAAAEPLNRTIH